MEFEQIKNKFIKLKKEELYYIASVTEISSQRKLSEYEKIEIYRNIRKYEERFNEIFKAIFDIAKEKNFFEDKDFDDPIIEFSIDDNYISSLKINDEYNIWTLLNRLNVNMDNHRYELSFRKLVDRVHNKVRKIDVDTLLNGQKLIDKPIYIFCGYYDYSADCFGPFSSEKRDGVYKIIFSDSNYRYEIPENQMDNFEKDKIIIRAKPYVDVYDVEEIFREELLNTHNHTIDDCALSTQKAINMRSYLRSPEYKEKVLLDRINKLYEQVRGTFIKSELLFSGKFLDILREAYKLPNNRIVEKEKVVKNNGKDSVIIIAITQYKKYIVTFQNRINEKIIAEFPAGYIEENEDVLGAAKRELKEETGYETDDLFIVDQAYTSPGTDNSTSYVVVANNCIIADEVTQQGNELLEYTLFTEEELQYLINNNIMNGSMNKLAYYSLINNTDDCNITYCGSNKRIYKKQKTKNMNPLK